MADKPILFSAPMIRAILREIEAPGTGKTQTRRMIKDAIPGMHMDRVGPTGHQWTGPGGIPRIPFKPPYSPGDRLWVREAHALVGTCDPEWVLYRASGYENECIRHGFDRPYPSETDLRWRPSIHMPRWASRLTLHVTDVRVQRLQDISEADARAEGLSTASKDRKIWKWGIPDRDGLPGNDDDGWDWCDWSADARLAFRDLWDSLNAKRAPWPSNPWVVAITFRPVLGNIDNEGDR